MTAPERRVRLRTTDVDTACHDVSNAFASHELRLRDAHQLDVKFDATVTEGLSAARLAYGTETTIVGPPMESRYHFNLPFRGESSAGQAHKFDSFSAGQSGIAFNPDEPFYLWMSRESEQLHLSIPRTDLHLHARKFLAGSDVDIVFDVTYALNHPAGRALFSALTFFFTETARQDGLNTVPAAAHEFASALMTQILFTIPNSLSAELNADPTGPRPTRIHEVARYVEENAMNSLTTADLASAAGMSGRALHEGFKRQFGTTPMRYLRHVRLDRVKQEIENSHEPITEIAQRWHFFHPGRFSGQYKQRFGELPSETRAKRTCR